MDYSSISPDCFISEAFVYVLCLAKYGRLDREVNKFS